MPDVIQSSYLIASKTYVDQKVKEIGEPGKSAYEIAKAKWEEQHVEPFMTEEEWLESLKGEQGQTRSFGF